LLLEILHHCPVVREDESLHTEVVARLTELTDTPVWSAPLSDELAEAMARYTVAA
jgi:hypothetical protein